MDIQRLSRFWHALVGFIKKAPLFRMAWLSMLLTVLAACDFSISADVVPPTSYVRQSTAQAAVQPTPLTITETSFPLVPPDPAQGAEIYAEKCGPCHGAGGMGDGIQAARQPLAVKPLAVPEMVRSARPSDWYSVVTRGRLDRNMPAYGTSLTDAQRWNVVAYLYTLSVSPLELQQGKAVFTEMCQSCHGEKGKGDGPRAASLSVRPPDWSDTARMAQRSLRDMMLSVSVGAGQGMPAFSDKLNESQRWAVAAYLRTLSFRTQNGTTPEIPAISSIPMQSTVVHPPVNTLAPSSEPASGTVIITGNVTGFPGGIIPTGLPVYLRIFDNMMETASLTGQVLPDASYRFDAVPWKTGRAFITFVDYQKNLFSSSVARSAVIVSGQVLNLPIQIIESSTDISVLYAERVHLFLDVVDTGRLGIVEMFIITNPTKKVVGLPGTRQPVVKFDLPVGAQNLQIEDEGVPERFIKTETGFGDTASVDPGEGVLQLMFAYELPYSGQVNLEIPFSLPVRSGIVMVSNGMKVESFQLESAGTRSIQGADVEMYNAGRLPAGGKLSMNITGQPVAISKPESAGENSSTGLAVGIGVFLLALGAVGFFFFRTRRPSGSVVMAEEDDQEGQEEMTAADEDEDNSEIANKSLDVLLDDIVALDDLFQAGELPLEAYQQRRNDLKEAIQRLKEKTR